ncbi:hypothetical protein OIU77_024804 [Salix suchowensis]|uniref:Uncharacterized protein n=1 Tax=Salix suchowensis TaxID=1278906 RepID=A0ABQ9BVS4_9ROSI|nr:hypothetical protein OIU77_024804 [Salix suchowensis]
MMVAWKRILMMKQFRSFNLKTSFSTKKGRKQRPKIPIRFTVLLSCRFPFLSFYALEEQMLCFIFQRSLLQGSTVVLAVSACQ